jgi:hypothetical protein
VSQLPEQLTITPSKTPFKSIVLILIVSLANTPVPLYNITAHKAINRKHRFCPTRLTTYWSWNRINILLRLPLCLWLQRLALLTSDSIISNLISSYKRIILKFRSIKRLHWRNPHWRWSLGRTMSTNQLPFWIANRF